jgi:homopolymeric O-antigen transport system permease protein
MVTVSNGFRWSISGGRNPLFIHGLSVGLIVTLLLLVSGIWYFRRLRKRSRM